MKKSKILNKHFPFLQKNKFAKSSSYFFGASFLIYTFIVGLSFSLQKQLILHPKKLKTDHIFDLPFKFEEVALDNDAENIHGIHAFSPAKSKKLILYFHGNAGNLDRWANYSTPFLELGYDVLMMDYRGFGKSTGKANEENMYEDGLTFYEYAIKHYDPKNIVLYGRSIGTGVATELATRVPSAQLVLETPFYTMEDVIKERYPLLWIPGRLHFEFDNATKIGMLDIPVHIFHGTNDKIVPLDSAIKLKPILKSEDSFTIIEDAKHKNIASYPQYHNVLKEIL